MQNLSGFSKCIVDSRTGLGYGKRRIDEELGWFERRAAMYEAGGVAQPMANMKAMDDTIANVMMRKNDRAVALSSQLGLIADMDARLEKSASVVAGLKGFFTQEGAGEGTRIGLALQSAIETDIRFGSVSYTSVRNAIGDRLRTLLADSIETFGKGLFGRARGRAHEPNIALAVMDGRSTGDMAADAMAKAWQDVTTLIPKLFRQAGGAMNDIPRYMPQDWSSSLVRKAGVNTFIEDMLDPRNVDWDRVRTADNMPIPPEFRRSVLKDMYMTVVSDGAHKIDDKAYGGRGRNIGNMMEQHRFLIIRDGEAWNRLHQKYMEGSVFDLMHAHISFMARRIALVKMFGRNPDAWFAMANRAALKRAAERNVSADISSKLTLFRTMFDNTVHPIVQGRAANIMDTTIHAATASKLGSAFIAAMPSDFLLTLMRRKFNRMPLFANMDMYITAMLPGNFKSFEKTLAHLGVTNHQLYSSALAATRWYTDVADGNAKVSRTVADVAIRASGLSRHTDIARGVNQLSIMNYLHEMRDTPLAEIPGNNVIRRYNITDAEWDLIRKKVGPYVTENGAEYLRPLDVLTSGIEGAEDLYLKLYNIIDSETAGAVFHSSATTNAMLGGGVNPNTVTGIAQKGIRAFRSFGTQYMLQVGRLALSSPTLTGRWAWAVSYAAILLPAGYMALQLGELVRGRKLREMNAQTLFDALLAGGSFGPIGDILIRQTAQEPFGGVGAMVAGPPWALVDDVVKLAKDKQLGTFASKWTPGSSIWYLRTALKNYLFDQIDYIIDPATARRRWQAQRRFAEELGGGYYFGPGGQRQ